jgi:hypothetical protein
VARFVRHAQGHRVQARQDVPGRSISVLLGLAAAGVYLLAGAGSFTAGVIAAIRNGRRGGLVPYLLSGTTDSARLGR